MAIEALIEKHRQEILARWMDTILSTYSEQASAFFGKQKNQFSNPVGTRLGKNAAGLIEALVGGMETDVIHHHLDEIIQLRSVQEFSPSEAVGIVFYLKKAVRETLAESIGTDCRFEELLAFETKIDKLALYAFDIFMKYKEKLLEIQTNELKRMSKKLIERMNDMGPFSGVQS